MKKIICLVLIFTMILTACSKWNVEIVDPTEKPSESLADIISGESDIDKEDEEKAATTIDDLLGLFNEISIECGN